MSEKTAKTNKKRAKKYKNCRKIPQQNNQNKYKTVNQHFTKVMSAMC